MLVGKSSAAEPAVSGLDQRFAGKELFWMRFIGERLFFLGYEKDPGVRYSFSPAVTGSDIAGDRMVEEADIIHLHWINFGFLSVRSLRQLFELGKPVVWTLHDMWAFTGGCHYSGECRRFTVSCGNCIFLKTPAEHDLSYRRLLLKKRLWDPASKLVAVACSRWLEQEAQSSSLLQPFRVTNIPNPIDTGVFKPSDREKACSSLGLPAGRTYFLFAAAKVSSHLKGFAFLKEALSLLAEEMRAAEDRPELLVIGGGSPELLEDIPLKAHFLGYISGDENLVNVYGASSLYVTPSVEDNLPNTVMEALACGVPVVGFRTGGIPEMIDHQKNGFVADYKSPRSLADGIRWVMENNTRGALSRAARNKVLEEYDEKVIAGRYRELYKSMLG